MSKYQNTVEYSLKTTLDRTGFAAFQGEMGKCIALMDKANHKESNGDFFAKDVENLQKLQTAMNNAFNSTTGLMNLSKLQGELSGLNINSLLESFKRAGAVGQSSLNGVIEQVSRIDTSFKSVSSTFDNVFRTFSNTLRWGISASILETISNSLNRSVEYVKELDKSLNDIRIVSGQSAAQMQDFTTYANQAAQAVGQTTTAFTNASLIYAQQGFDQDMSNKLAETTLKMANVTGQDTATASEQVTAIMNGYKLGYDDLNSSLDSLANVAAQGASDMNELATAESKVAATASTLGVSQNQLAAQISTIISVTRQAPENVGNSLKTLYARMGDLELGDTLEDGVSLGEVSQTLQMVGVDILDVNGDMRDMGTVMEELMGKWDGFSRAEKQAIAIKLAGKHQYNNLMTLLENSKMYNEQLQIANDSEGTLDEQQDIYMDSLLAKSNALQAAGESVISSLFDSDSTSQMIDTGTKMLNIIDQIVKSLGGGLPLVNLFTSALTKLFSRNLGESLGNFMQNFEKSNAQKKNQSPSDVLASMGFTESAIKDAALDPSVLEFVNNSKDLRGSLSDKQAQDYNEIMHSIVDTSNARAKAEEESKNYGRAITASKDDRAAEVERARQASLAKEDARAAREAAAIQAQTDAAIKDAGIGTQSLATLQNRSNLWSGRNENAQALAAAVQAATSQSGRNEGGLKQSSKTGTYIDNINNTAQNLMGSLGDSKQIARVRDALDQFNAVEAKGETATQDYAAALNKLSSAAESIGGSTSENLNKVQSQIEALTGAQEKQSKALGELDKKKAAAKDEIEKSAVQQDMEVEQYDTEHEKSLQAKQDAANLRVGDAKSQEGQASRVGEDWINEIQDKQRYQSVTNMVGAVGQLAFAWSSFQTLGDLMKNTDMSPMEKFQSVAMNLAMTLPTLVDGIKTMRTGLSSEALLTTAEKFKEMSGDLLDRRSKGDGLQAGLLGAASAAKVAEGSLKGLQGIMASLTSTWGLAVLGIVGVASALYDAAIAADKAKISAGQSDYDAAYEKSQVDTSTFDEAYEEYKKTGQASDDLKNSSKELVDSLGIVGGQALINAGNFDELASKISDASEASKVLAARAAQSQISNIQDYEETYHPGQQDDFLHTLTNQEDYYGWGDNDGIKQRTGIDVDLITNQDKSGMDLVQQIGAINKMVDEAKSNFDDLNQAKKDALAADPNADTSDLDKQMEHEQDLVKQGQAVLGQSGAASVSQIVQQQAEAQAKALDTSEFEGLSTDEIRSQLTDTNSESYAAIAQQVEAYGGLGSDAGKAYVDALLDQIAQADPSVALQVAQEKLATYSQDVQDQVNNADLSDEQLVQLVGTLDESLTTEQINNKIKDIQDGGGLQSVELPTDYDDALKSANSDKSGLDSLYSTYENGEGEISTEDVAGILQENPEYVDYLTKVGDHYALNEQAMKDWTAASQEQEAAVDDMMGGTDYLDGYDDLLSGVQSSDSHEFDNEAIDTAGLDDFINKNQELNQSLQDGEISVQDYYDSLGSGLDDSGIFDTLSNINGAFDETTDYAEEFAATTTSEVSDALVQSSKRFSQGEESVSDYMSDLDDGLSIQKKFLKSTYNLQEGEDGLVSALDDSDEAAQNAADSYNAATEAQQDMSDVSGVADMLSNNADFLSEYTDEYGNLMDSITSDSRYTDYVSQMSDSVTQFAATNQDNMAAMVDAVASSAGVSRDVAQSAIEASIAGNSDALVSIAGSSVSSVNGITQALMGQVSGTISNASQAVGSVLSSLGAMISGFSFKIEATPHISGGFGLDQDENGIPTGIHLPTFGFDIVGSGGTSVQDFASSLTNAGNYFTGAGNTEAAAKALNINSYKPSGSGSGSTPSSYRPSYTPKKSGGGGGGGKGGSPSGGSGGSGKSYEPKSKDQEKNDIDRYEKVQTKLDAIGNDLSIIADEQDRLTGYQLADNMGKQIQLLYKQIDLQKEKLKIQKEEAAEYKNSLAAQYGIQFNQEGFITNYADRYSSLLSNLNGLISEYNATSTESGQEALDSQIDAAKDSFKEFSDLVEKYDKLQSDSISDSEKSIEEFYDKIEDMRIDAFKKTVEAADNIKDIQEALIDFNSIFSGFDADSPWRDMENSSEKLKKYWDVGKDSMESYYNELIARNNKAMKEEGISDSSKKWLQYQNQELVTAKAQYGKGTLESGGTGYLDMQLKNLNTILDEINEMEAKGESNIFGKDSADLYDVANDVFEAATDAMSDYEDSLGDLKDAIEDAIDEIGDRIDDRMDKFEAMSDQLDHYKDMVEMIHGENAYGELNEAGKAVVINNENQIAEMRKDVAVLKDLQAGLKEGSDEWKDVQEKIDDMQSDLLDKTSDTMQEIVDIWTRGIDAAMDEWIHSTLGDTLDNVQQEWELIGKNADHYLDDVNASYNIQKLQSKYLQMLDQSNDLLVQNKITAQMKQQLQYLREKKNLSEYDVQYANAQLDLLQKRIALEEAQRNKSQMKLSRDTQGNYSYVYAANEGDTASAQEDLLDSQNSAYNLSKDQMTSVQNDAISALQDYYDQLKAIQSDLSLTEEERTKKSQELQDAYVAYLQGCAEQLSDAQKNLIQDFIGMVDLMGEENNSKMTDVYNQIVAGNIDAFDQIDDRWSTSITSWLQNMDQFQSDTDKMFGQLEDNSKSYKDSLDKLSSEAGVNFDDITSHIHDTVDATNDLASSTQDFINQLKNDSGTVKEYEGRLSEMTSKIQDAQNAMKAYKEQVNDLSSKLTSKEQENANLSSEVQKLQNQIKDQQDQLNGGGGSGSGGGSGANDATAWGIAQAIWTYGSRSGWGNDPLRSSKLIGAYGSGFAQSVQSYINKNTRNGSLVNYDSMSYSSYNLIGYKTGGYTGTFSSSDILPNSQGGRLSVLHPNELVLNESDTKNMLAAVGAIRDTVGALRGASLSETLGALSGLAAGAVSTPTQVDQKVSIEASFPAVNTRQDIEDAFSGLILRAQQLAARG